MINSIAISNFKCFEQLEIDNVRAINVIVGDNGSSKTACMEAVFLALNSTSDSVNRYRVLRGLELNTNFGSPSEIEKSVFEDLFFNCDLSREIKVRIHGNAQHNRTLTIEHGISDAATRYFRKLNPNFYPAFGRKPFLFGWKDSKNEQRYVIPGLNAQNQFQWAAAAEELEDFFYFGATHNLNPLETTARYSRLTKKFHESDFKSAILDEFEILSDVSIELHGGVGILHATVPKLAQKLPLPFVSGAVNRIIALLVAIATSHGSVVLVDEMDTGIYYKHQTQIWKSIIKFVRAHNCQIITTTHSLEWMRALVAAAGDDQSDVALWRFERNADGSPEIFTFDGETLRAGIEFGNDPRASFEE